MKQCRLLYFGYFTIWTIWACVLRWKLGEGIYNAGWLQWLPLVKSLKKEKNLDLARHAIAMTPVTMMFIFHAVMAIITLGAECSKPKAFLAVHRKGMGWKFLAQFILWFLFLMIPYQFYTGISYFFYVVSALFLIAQAVVMLESSYRLNNKLVPRGAKGGQLVGIIVVLVLVYGACIAFFICDFVLWTESDAPLSTEPIVVMTVGIALCIVFTVLACVFEHATITASAFISLFVILHLSLIYQATGTNPSWWLPSSTKYQTALESFEIIYLSASIFFGALSVISIKSLFGAADKDYGDYDGYDSTQDEETGQPSYAYYGFHTIIACASAYLVIPFGSFGGATNEWIRYSVLTGVMAGSLLYIWTLTAPKCFPNRNFGV